MTNPSTKASDWRDQSYRPSPAANLLPCPGPCWRLPQRSANTAARRSQSPREETHSSPRRPNWLAVSTHSGCHNDYAQSIRKAKLFWSDVFEGMAIAISPNVIWRYNWIVSQERQVSIHICDPCVNCIHGMDRNNRLWLPIFGYSRLRWSSGYCSDNEHGYCPNNSPY